MSLQISDFYDSNAIAAHFRENANNKKPFLGKPRFPSQKKDGIDLKWITGKTGIPVALQNSAFDAEPTLRDRIGVDRIETEMPFFREAMQLKEKDMIELARAEEANDPLVRPVIQGIFNDSDTLLRAAEIVPERMIWQLLAPVGGKMGIEISNNNVPYTYLYDPDGEWKAGNYLELAPGDQWTAANQASAKPLDNFYTMQQMVEDAGGDTATVAIMSRETFNRMAATDQLKNAIIQRVGIGQIAYTGMDIIKAAVDSNVQLGIVVYEKKFRVSRNAAPRAFLPDGYVSLVPGDAELGSFWYGVTPEELANRRGKLADFALYDQGITISNQELPVSPFKTETVASLTGMPSFEGMYNLGVMKVF